MDCILSNLLLNQALEEVFFFNKKSSHTLGLLGLNMKTQFNRMALKPCKCHNGECLLC